MPAMMSPVAAGVVNMGERAVEMPEGLDTLRPTKLFIGGITRNTTTKQLRDHFSCFGRVLDCVAMRQPDGRPRGFGYVTLDSSQAADRCLAIPQVIDGRVVDMKRAVPEGDMDSAPITRLHTPSSRGGKSCILSAGPVSPASASSPTAGWPFGYNLLQAQLAAQAQCWPGHWQLGAPDCIDLLSSAAGTPLATSPLATSPTGPALLSTVPPSQAWPETPTGSLSAAAPEFVPSAPKEKRSALGDITNIVSGNAKEQEVKKISKAPANLEIDTEDIYEDEPQMIGSPPGLEVYVDPEAEHKEPATDSEEEEEDDEDYSLEVSGPPPSIGSVQHVMGTCKRCNFFPKGRCQNGDQCTFCHYPHDKRKASRQEKRERKAQLQFEKFPEEDQDTQIMAYPMFPGMPPLQTTKLPTPLALPSVMPCLSTTAVAPPPGLAHSCLGFSTDPKVPWQPDEEVSPVRAQVAPQVSHVCSGSFLSTTPVASQVVTTAVETAAPMKVMITMGTQTEEDEEPEKISREHLLSFRHASSCEKSGLKAEAM